MYEKSERGRWKRMKVEKIGEKGMRRRKRRKRERRRDPEEEGGGV